VKVKDEYKFGLRVSWIQAFTTDDKWQKCILDRNDHTNLPMKKLIQVKGFAVDFNSEMKNILEPSKIIDDDLVHFMLQFTQDDTAENKVNIKLVIPQVEFNFFKIHYEALEILNTKINSYFEEVFNYDSKRPYFANRPLFSLKEKHNARAWWIYAIRTICKLNKAKTNKLIEKKEELIQDFYQSIFIRTFIKLHLKVKEITEMEMRMYEKILFMNDMKTICNWVISSLYQVEKDEQENKKPSEFLGGLFNWKVPKKEIKEEKKESIESKAKRLYENTINNPSKKEVNKNSFGFELEVTSVILITNIRGKLENTYLSIRKSKDRTEVRVQVKSFKVIDEDIIPLSTNEESTNCLTFAYVKDESEKVIKTQLHLVSILFNS